MKKVLTLSFSTGIILSILLFAFSGIIVTKFLGVQYENSIIILRILSITLVLNSVSYTFGILTFIPMGYDKLYYRIVVSSAIIHILLLFLIVPKFFATGTASVLVFTELLLMLQYIFFYKRKF